MKAELCGQCGLPYSSSAHSFVVSAGAHYFVATPEVIAEVVQAAPTHPAIPTIHLNGTSGASLIEQNRLARTVLRTAITALQEARPHPRDYYPQGELVFGHAQSEHKSRMERLESVLYELEELGHALARSR